MRGSISIVTIASIVIISLAAAYYYIDNKADLRAQHTLIQLVDDAKAEGVELNYTTVDASPLFRSVVISDFKISGGVQEPDITLGLINITGFNWQDLNQENGQLPLAMSIKIDNASLYLKPSMIENDDDLQALVNAFGERINFSIHFAYTLNETSGLLTISTTETMADNFTLNSELSFGSAGWLASTDANSNKKPMQDMMSTTLNSLSIDFKNNGIIEKIRSVAAKKTGNSTQDLVQDSVVQIKQLQHVAQKNWGPLFVPMIDELLKFTVKPEQLKISINPKQPLTTDDLILGMMGGDTGLLTLIKQAQIEIKAN